MKQKVTSARSWLWLSVLIIGIDQLTKYWAISYLSGQPMPVLPFLNFRLAFNYGAAFSFLSDPGGWTGYLFLGLALVVSMVLTRWLFLTDAKEKYKAFALSALIGGALGNVIDRVMHGFVIDFIDFHIGHWHFATFNIADSAISIGAVVLILVMFFEGRQST